MGGLTPSVLPQCGSLKVFETKTNTWQLFIQTQHSPRSFLFPLSLQVQIGSFKYLASRAWEIHETAYIHDAKWDPACVACGVNEGESMSRRILEFCTHAPTLLDGHQPPHQSIKIHMKLLQKWLKKTFFFLNQFKSDTATAGRLDTKPLCSCGQMCPSPRWDYRPGDQNRAAASLSSTHHKHWHTSFKTPFHLPCKS